jgi:hypothetical protein
MSINIIVTVNVMMQGVKQSMNPQPKEFPNAIIPLPYLFFRFSGQFVFIVLEKFSESIIVIVTICDRCR